MRKLLYVMILFAAVSLAGLAVWAAAKAATVRIIAEDHILLLTFENKMKLRVTSKATKLKPGEYQVKKYSIYKKDDKKKTWEIRCDQRLGNLKVVMVSPGQEKILDPGPPLDVHSWARQGDGDKADTVTISFSLVGKYSETYLPYAFCGKRKPKPPVVIIKNEENEVIHKAVMSVGGAACRYVWKPGAFKGAFKLDWKVDLGPFKWKYVNKIFEVK